MTDSSARGGTVHSSAHPSLAPAKAEQVVQYLLAHNYTLTALELLVESQAAGHADEFPELEVFFSNPDRFPPEEVSRHAQTNALDQQALSREREHKLQLLEYELRLAKEDLCSMSRRLAAASTPATPTARNSLLHAATSEPISRALSIQTSGGGGHALPDAQSGAHHTPQAMLPNPFANHYVDPNQPASTQRPADVDWSRLGSPTDAEHAVVLAAVLSYCLHLGLRTSALTLKEELAEVMAGGDTSAGVAELLQSHTKTEGLTLWRWSRLARSLLAEQGSAALEVKSEAALKAEAEEVKSQLAVARAQVKQLEEEAAAGRAAHASALSQISVLKKALEEANTRLTAGTQGAAPGEGPVALGLLAAGSAELTSRMLSSSTSSPPHRQASACTDPSHSTMQAIVTQLTELLPRIMPALTIKTRLEILPMVQAVILAAPDPDTQRALTGLVFNGVATPDPVQRGAVVALCVGVAAQLGPAWAAQELLVSCTKQVSSPNAERRVLVAEMMQALLNPSAVQLLPTYHCPGVVSLPPVLEGPLIDCDTQSHALLTALHRLAEDRMEQVREAAVGSLVALLKPGCLAFSRTYYSVLEELLIQLVCDTESVAGLALDSLAPALQAWSQLDLTATSLLPRVVSEVSRLSREAQQNQLQQQTANSTGQGPSTAFSGSVLSYGLSKDASGVLPSPASLAPTPTGRDTQLSVQGSAGSTLAPRPSINTPNRQGGFLGSSAHTSYNTQRFACWEHQAMYQLLQLYSQLLPSLRTSALQAVPIWALAAAASNTPAPATQQPQSAASTQPFQRVSAPTLTTTVTASNSTTADTSQGSGADPSATAARLQRPGHQSQPDLQQSAGGKSDTATASGTTEALAGRNSEAAAGGPSRASSSNTCIVHLDVHQGSGLDFLGASSVDVGGDTLGGASVQLSTGLLTSPTEGGAGLGVLNALPLVAGGEVDGNALFAAACSGSKSNQWKRMQWIVQFLVPELVELARTLGSPTHAPLSTSSQPSQHSASAPPAPDVLAAGTLPADNRSSFSGPSGPSGGASFTASSVSLHRELSKVLALTATTFGPGWTQAVLVPLFCAASACAAPDLLTGSGTLLEEALEQLTPQNAQAAITARVCVLPHLLCSVLPYALPSATEDWLTALTRVSMEATPSFQPPPPFFGLYLAPGSPVHPQWVTLAQLHLAAALGYACSNNLATAHQTLQVLESIAHSRPTSPSPHLKAPTSPTPPPLLMGLSGTLAITLAQGLLPLLTTATAQTPFATPAHSSWAGAGGYSAGPLEVGAQYMPAVPHQPPATTPGVPDNNGAATGSGEEGGADGGGEVALPPMPGSAAPGPHTPAAWAKRVMSLLMVVLSGGDLETKCGVVQVLLEMLLKLRAGGSQRSMASTDSTEESKVVEQVCVVYDGLLASGNPTLVSTVLTATLHLTLHMGPLASKSTAAAQILEWVLQAVQGLAVQLSAPPTPGSGPPSAPGAYDNQRHQAVQLLCIAHAAFMQDTQMPRLSGALQSCVKALSGIRVLLPDPYSAVLTPMLANNRPAAATAMTHAQSTAAAMSAAAAGSATAAAGGAGMPVVAYQPQQAADQQHNLSPQQLQYLQQQRQQSAVAATPVSAGFYQGQANTLTQQASQQAPGPHVDTSISSRFERFASKFGKKGKQAPHE